VGARVDAGAVPAAFLVEGSDQAEKFESPGVEMGGKFGDFVAEAGKGFASESFQSLPLTIKCPLL